VAELEDLLALVRQAQPHLARTGPETEGWLSRLEERHDDLHDLVERLLAEDATTAAEVSAALWSFWWQRGHMREGRELLERAAALNTDDRAPVLKGLGTIAFRQGDLEAAERAFHERFELIERDGSPAELADACADLARVALRRGDFGEVRRWAERGYEAADGLDDPAAIRLPLHMRAAAARMEGRYDEARELYLRSIELNERLGNEVNIAGENHNLFYVALHSGDREEARRRFQTASAWIFANNNAYLRPYAFLDAGVLALNDSDDERACRLVACAQRIFEETDSIPDPDDHVELDHAVATLRERLGDRFDQVWADGQALSVDEAQALASVQPPPTEPDAD
jgi:tetratricopeptide (TPR) repeat protein